MKAVTVNVQIQFDAEGVSKENITNYVREGIDLVNLELQRSGIGSQPQILSSGLDRSDIEVQTYEDEDED